MNIELAPLGTLELQQPASWSARVALEQAYLKHQDDGPKVAFIYAAAIGLTADRNAVSLPRFNLTSVDILGYGVVIMDHLVGKLEVAPGPSLWAAGSAAVKFISDSIPREAQVSEAVDFTSQNPAGSS